MNIMPNHALEILNCEKHNLRKMIRTCKQNGDIVMSDIPYDEYEKQLNEINLALKDIAEMGSLRASNKQKALEAEERFYTADKRGMK